MEKAIVWTAFCKAMKFMSEPDAEQSYPIHEPMSDDFKGRQTRKVAIFRNSASSFVTRKRSGTNE